MKTKNRSGHQVPALIAALTALFALAAVLTGCSQTDGEPTAQQPTLEPEEPRGTTIEAPPLGTPETEEPEPVMETERPTKPEYGEFGGVGFTFEDGLVVTVSAVTMFEPSEWAATGTSFENYLRFDVTVTNNTAEPFDPISIYSTLSSGGAEGESVFDSENGLGGSPQTTVLPGKSITWSEGWGVSDPADLVFEIAPSFDHEPALFVGGAS